MFSIKDKINITSKLLSPKNIKASDQNILIFQINLEKCLSQLKNI